MRTQQQLFPEPKFIRFRGDPQQLQQALFNSGYPIDITVDNVAPFIGTSKVSLRHNRDVPQFFSWLRAAGFVKVNAAWQPRQYTSHRHGAQPHPYP